MDTVFDGAPVPWDVLHDSTKRSTLLSNADKFSVFKSLDPSRMSRSELYDILQLIGAEQKDDQYFIEFTPDDDLLVAIQVYSVTSDDEIMELPDRKPRRTNGTRKRVIQDSDDDAKSIPGLPDFSPAIVVPTTPPIFRILNQPVSEIENITQPDTTVKVSTASTVSTASENPESATHSQLGPLNPSVVYSAINAVIASGFTLPNPLPLPSTSSIPTRSLNQTQVVEIASGLPAVTQPELEVPVGGLGVTALKANSKRKGSKLKRKVAEKQDSEVKLPKSKKLRVNKPAPVEPVPSRSSSRFVIV